MLAPMRSELQPIIKLLSLKLSNKRSATGGASLYKGRVGRTEVTATTIGVGPAAARRATEQILRQRIQTGVPVDHVIVCGIAGGVAHDQEIGSMVVPDLVVDGTTRAEFRPDVLGGVPAEGTILTVGELVLDPVVIDGLVAE